jgi:hypothetical protein
MIRLSPFAARSAPFALLLAVLAVTALAPVATHDPAPLTVHEWGTFTSIADADGRAAEWRPLSGPQDLPCFVDRIRYTNKGLLIGTIRMETPVLYFYAAQPATVDVRVRFRQGLITEWFPRAEVDPVAVEPASFSKHGLDNRIAWKNVKLEPGSNAAFPNERGSSHYYAARATDATPLSVGNEREKFLFYRGVGRFAPPLMATVGADETVSIRSQWGAIGDVIVFENRAGAIRFGTSRASGRRIEMPAATLKSADLTTLRRTMERILVQQGLYEKEAAAMLETWRDSWFEQGTRVFYIAPKVAVDAILPLEINPVPADVARVFVGRLELVTPRTIHEVKQALLKSDRTTLEQLGRFFEPFVARVIASSPAAEQVLLEKGRQAFTTWYYSSRTTSRSCN